MSIQNDSFPTLSGVLPASDIISAAPAEAQGVSVKRLLDVLRREVDLRQQVGEEAGGGAQALAQQVVGGLAGRVDG